MRARICGWKPLAFAAVPTLVLLLTAGGRHASAEDSASRVSVSVRDGRVTLAASDVPLRTVLTEFSRATGIAIFLQASVRADESTTVALDGVLPVQGVRRLLRARNFTALYAAGGALSEVRVYTGTGGGFQRLVPVEPPPGAGAKPSRERDRGGSAAVPTAAEVARMRAQALGHPDPSQRAAGLDELAAGDDQQLALDTATKVLQSERVAKVLQSALSILADADSAPLDPLLSFVGGERAPDAEVRIQALQILAERGPADARVRDLLKRLAGNDKDRDVRETARDLLEGLSE